MIMIWLLAAKTRSQRAKTMMPAEAFGGLKGVVSSHACSPHAFSRWRTAADR